MKHSLLILGILYCPAESPIWNSDKWYWSRNFFFFIHTKISFYLCKIRQTKRPENAFSMLVLNSKRRQIIFVEIIWAGGFDCAECWKSRKWTARTRTMWNPEISGWAEHIFAGSGQERRCRIVFPQVAELPYAVRYIRRCERTAAHPFEPPSARLYHPRNSLLRYTFCCIDEFHRRRIAGALWGAIIFFMEKSS